MRSSDDPKQPPNVISAKALDANFTACQPLQNTSGNNLPYTAITGKDGWRLSGAFLFDVCENGTAVQYRFFAERA